MSLYEVAGKGEALERTAGMGVVLGEGSRSGRRAVSAAREAAAQCDTDHPEQHKQDPETTKGTSLGSEDTGRVWCDPESHIALQSDSCKKGSLSKVTMRTGEIYLENGFILILWSLGIFCNLKAGLCLFHITYPFFSLKAFCLLTLSSYRMRSRQIQITQLPPFCKSVVSGHLVFLQFLSVKDTIIYSLVWLSVGLDVIIELTITSCS